MTEVEEISRQVKATAQKILDETNIIETLREFGEVTIGGSYKYDLMWGPDIDLTVICPNPMTAVTAAMQKLLELRQFQKYEIGDFEKFPMENRPKSQIMILRTYAEGVRWEIEIWFFDRPSENEKETDKLMERLDSEKRIRILQMKKQRDETGADKHKLRSFEIYETVLS